MLKTEYQPSSQLKATLLVLLFATLLESGAQAQINISSTTTTLSAPSTTMPASIPGLVVHLDANDVNNTGTNPANGTQIGTWVNKAAGGAGDFTGAVSPYVNWTSNRMNGNSVVHFWGGTLSNDTNFGNDVTVLYTGRMDGGSNERLLSGRYNNWLLGYWGGGINRNYWNGSPQNLAGSGATDYLGHIFVGTADGVTASNFNADLAEVSYGSGPLGVSGQGPNGLVLGGSISSELSYADIGELLVFDRALTAPERLQMEQYLQGKWFGDLATLPNAPAQTVNITSGGKLDLNGVNQTIGALSGDSSAQVLLNGAWLTTGQNNASSIYAGTIDDGASPGKGFSKVGTGTLTLTGAAPNTFSGPTVISQGQLALSKDAGVAAIPGNLVLLNSLSPTVWTTNDNQFGAGSVISFETEVNTLVGNARVNLIGTTQTVAGIVDTSPFRGGVIQNSETVGGAPANNGNSTLVLEGDGNYTFNGYLRNASGTLGLTKNGTGTQTLGGDRITYTGPTIINDGTLELVNTTGFNSATVINSGGVLKLSNTVNTANGAGFSIQLNDGGTLTHAATTNGNGYFVLNGAVINSGTTTINQDSVTNTTGANKSLFLDGGLQGTGTVTINATNPGNGVVFRNNNTNFSGTLIVNGIASTVANQGSGIGVGGATTGLINADITLNGTMELLNQGVGWAGSAPGDFWMGALNGNGVMVGNFTAGGQTRVRIGNTNNSGLFSGSIADGTGNHIVLTKNGTGTQTFVGSNFTYTGSTTVAQGTLSLQMAGSGSSFNSAINIANGATLDLTTSNGGVDNWVFDTPISGVAGSLITKNGSGWVQVRNPGGLGGFGGTLVINDGIFGNGFNAVGDWTGSTADVVVNGSGVLDLRTDNITIDTLSGNGTVGNSYGTIDPVNTLTLGTGNGIAAFAGQIRGAGGGANNSSMDAGRIAIVKTGSGVQYFDGNNTYAGTTTVQSGYLVIGRDMGLGSAAAGTIVQSGGTLQLENRGFGDVNIAGETANISGQGVGGTRGALANWSGNNSWQGSVILNDDSRIFVNSGRLNLSGAISESIGGRSLITTGGGTLEFSGSNSNTYTGTTTIAGTETIFNKTGGAVAVAGNVIFGTGAGQPNLRIAQNNQFGPGVEMLFNNPAGQWTRFDLQGTTQTLAGINGSLGGGVVQNERFGGGGTSAPGTLILNGSGAYSYDGYIRDEDDGGNVFKLNIVKNGSGTQVFSRGAAGARVHYTGTTTVNDGRLVLRELNDANGTRFNSSVVVNNGGVLEINTNNTTVDNWTYFQTFSGQGDIVKTGDGWFMLRSPNGMNGFSGMLTIEDGIFGNSFNAVGDWNGSLADVTIQSNGVLDLRTDNITIDGLFGSGQVGNTYGTIDPVNTLTLGVNNETAAVFSGSIRGAGGGPNNSSLDAGVISVIKNGSGQQTLTGANTYAGNTTVNGGVLELAGAGSLQNSNVVVNGGTFLQTSGTNQVTGNAGVNMLINSGGTYVLNGGTLDFQDNLSGSPGNTPSTLQINGRFEFNSGTLIDVSTVDPSGGTGVFGQAGGRFVVGRDGSQPGSAPALTTVLGDFDQTSGLLALDIVGANSQDIDMLAANTINLNGQLDVNANGVEIVPWHWYDAVKGDNITLGEDFDVIGDVGLYRLVLNPNGSGQILQVGVPEPGSMLLWGLLAAGAGVHVSRRRRRRRDNNR